MPAPTVVTTPRSAILLCGVSMQLGTPTPYVIGSIVGCNGIGWTHAMVPNIHNDLSGGWTELLSSCIRSLTPFTVNIVHNSNADWTSLASTGIVMMSCVWPVARGYSTGAIDYFEAGVSAYSFGSPDIEQRVMAAMTINPSGRPTHAEGTLVV